MTSSSSRRSPAARARKGIAAVLRADPLLLLLIATSAALFAYVYTVDPSRPGLFTPEGWFGFSDQGAYLRMGREMSDFGLSAEAFSYGPGYPMIAVPFLWLGLDYDPFAIFDGLAFVFAAAATFIVARRFFDRRVAAVAAFGLVLATPLVTYVVTPWNSTVTLVAALGVLLLATAPAARNWHAAVMGALVGWSFAARYVDIVWLGAIVVSAILLRRDLRRGRALAVAAVTCLAFCLPVLALHDQVLGSPVTTPYEFHVRGDDAGSDQDLTSYDVTKVPDAAFGMFLSPFLRGARQGGEALLQSWFWALFSIPGLVLALRRPQPHRTLLGVVAVAVATFDGLLLGVPRVGLWGGPVRGAPLLQMDVAHRRDARGGAVRRRLQASALGDAACGGCGGRLGFRRRWGAPTRRRAVRTRSSVVGVAGSGFGVIVGFGLWNLGNYLFFLVAGRLLGPADYGLVAALLSAALIIQTPFTSLQGAMARAIGGRPEIGGGLYVLALRRAAVATAVVGGAAALLVIAAGVISDAVPVGPLLATLVVVLPAGILPLALGQLQGEGRFAALAVGMASLGLPRPVFVLAFFAAGLGIYAALLGSAATAFFATGVVMWFSLGRLGDAPIDRNSSSWTGFSGSLLPFTVGIAATAVLTNVDVVVAKLALDPHDAGIFAAVAILSKAVFIVPQAVATVALPRVAARRTAGELTDRLLAAATGVTVAAGLAATGIAFVLAEPIIQITFGSEFADGAGILGAFTGVSALMGVVIVVLYHQLALGMYGFAWTLVAVAGAQTALLAVFHGSAEVIIAVDAACAVAALLAHDLMGRRSGDQIWRGMASLARRRRPSASRGDEAL